ncbi:GYD domain-containing protein [Aliidongia dinghuensis]|uniref:GYD domain-containing protein n=1 Tax=Aliidongia dinghuensis TaxID=1867774 RepID=A0A8J3E3M2_9PROT|nr:GYD domain-containing protein [Aliidongia dinghuensis]GGF31590.1 GYD domain-containing protein [Aliidongia dinghuensis]
MSAYFLLGNFTDQGIRTIKDISRRRAAARDLARTLGVEIKAGFMALGAYDLIIQCEAASDEAMAAFVLSLGTKGNVRTQTIKVFSEADADKIASTLV